MPENKRPLLLAGFPKILHGGDYNPDQWLHAPEVIDDDFRLMKSSGCNCFSVGIFAWTSYEKEEGKFDFGWLDRIMDRMAEAGNKVILATPTGAKPAWMSLKYPEIRLVNAQGQREPHGHRHNHCWSSPVYREKVRIINTKLAERYGKHPALALWHISNELGGTSLMGDCFCDLCQKRWQEWLEEKYGTLEKLNRAWWTPFWSHLFTAWEQIDPRDVSMDGMTVDRLRFVNYLMKDWYEFEAGILRPITPQIPITTNFMGLTSRFNYAELAKSVDIVTDDQYPAYDMESSDVVANAVGISFKDDLYRCFKPEKPWMLMESCPDAPQWKPLLRPKPAAVHQMEMFQALGHGSEGNCYFQWRKGLGSSEKLHGAVVDHSGRDDTRVFKSVAALSRNYEKLTPILGSTIKAEVALIYDWEVRWGLEASQGAARENNAYEETAKANYQPFWEMGISVDVLASDRDFSSYKLLILPQLWMLKPGVAERVRSFVEKGGTVVATCYLGICDESNLCFYGGWPGDGLMELFGVWNEENDSVPAGRKIKLTTAQPNPLSLPAELTGSDLYATLRAQGAEVVATYSSGQFAGTPAITVNKVGKGEAWYVGSRLEIASLRAFYKPLVERLQIKSATGAELPLGVTAQLRHGAERNFLFLQNFTTAEQKIALGSRAYIDLLSGQKISGEMTLPMAGSTVLGTS